MVYTDRIVELVAKPSTGTVGDSYDNALAEAVNGLYKTPIDPSPRSLAHRRAGRAHHARVGLVVEQTNAFTPSSTTAPRLRSSRLLRCRSRLTLVSAGGTEVSTDPVLELSA